MGINDLMENDSRVDVTDGDLKRVGKLVRELLSVQTTIANLEDQLKRQKEIERQISETDIPTAMSEIGIADFTLDTGEKVEIKSGVKASIPKKYTDAAIAWLKENNLGAIIKNEIKAKFGQGEDDAAAALYNAIIADGHPAEQKTAVHPGTLSAVVRERLEQGLSVPTEPNILGVYEYKVTKITPPKK